MRYGSVCSGIEAASVAWKPLGWTPAFFSEIAKFPSQLLAHHYGSNLPGLPLPSNGVPNLGDMTKFEEWPDYAIDVLIGGTPCQTFSLAGLRAGLADPRGILSLIYAAIAQRYRPRWVVWENVPGVLSHDGGRSFASILGLLSGRGIEVPKDGWKSAGIIPSIEGAYGLAWRVLDAQYVRVDGFGRAVPQRRRRVFIVGYIGDWRRAAAVLFEPESMCGDPPPSRQTAQDVAGAIAASSGRRGGVSEGERGSLIVGGGPQGGVVSGTVSSKWRKGTGGPAGDEVYNIIAQHHADVAATLPAGGNSTGGNRQPGMSAETAATMLIAFNAREDTDVSGDVMHPLGASAPQSAAICIHSDAIGRTGDAKTPSKDAAGAVRKRDAGMGMIDDGSSYNLMANHQPHAVAYDMRGREGGSQLEGPHDTANIRASSGGSSRSYVQDDWAVRRLTPLECERLQGFVDGYTAIPAGKKGKIAADGPRYEGLGNSMGVNVIRWLGRRIEMVEAL